MAGVAVGLPATNRVATSGVAVGVAAAAMAAVAAGGNARAVPLATVAAVEVVMVAAVGGGDARATLLATVAAVEVAMVAAAGGDDARATLLATVAAAGAEMGVAAMAVVVGHAVGDGCGCGFASRLSFGRQPKPSPCISARGGTESDTVSGFKRETRSW